MESARRDRLHAIIERLAAAAPGEDGTPGDAVNVDEFGQGEYAAAVIDMLEALGALAFTADHRSVRLASPQASYVLRLAGALLALDAPIVADWTTRGLAKPQEQLQRATNLAAALERRRLELVPDAAPLRETAAAVGLIARDGAAGREVLLYWDIGAQMWQPIGGARDPQDASFRAAMLRELAEELELPDLEEGRDVALDEVGSPFSTVRFSPTYGLLTRTTFAVFYVHLLRPLPQLHARLRWLPAANVLAGVTSDGQRISAEPLHPLLRTPQD